MKVQNHSEMFDRPDAFPEIQYSLPFASRDKNCDRKSTVVPVAALGVEAA